MTYRPYSGVIAKLKQAGLRPTRQRIALAKLLFENKDRHVSAEDLHEEARAASVSVSLATIYNTLHQFSEFGFDEGSRSGSRAVVFRYQHR